MDSIWLYGVECRVRLGVPVAERRRRQKVLIDVGLETDLAEAASRDDFQKAVDYWAIEKTVRIEAESKERRLAEALAEDVASVVLRTQPRVAAVRVLVHKKPAVMPRTREVVVEIRRSRFSSFH